MPGETRILQLLEKILDSDCTPEEACAGDPDLLIEVRARWEEVRRIGIQVDELFPSDSLFHATTIPHLIRTMSCRKSMAMRLIQSLVSAARVWSIERVSRSSIVLSR